MLDFGKDDVLDDTAQGAHDVTNKATHRSGDWMHLRDHGADTVSGFLVAKLEGPDAKVSLEQRGGGMHEVVNMSERFKDMSLMIWQPRERQRSLGWLS